MEAAIFKLASKYEAEVFMTCIEFSIFFSYCAILWKSSHRPFINDRFPFNSHKP